MRREYDMQPVPLVEFKDGDLPIAGGAGEKTPAFMRGPADDVDGGLVEVEVGDFGPLGVLLAPDEDFAVVGGGG